MLYKTRGIVLKTNKYSETSVTARIYTERFGIQSYIINAVHSKTARIKPGYLQPGTLLAMDVYHKPGRNLNRIKELMCLPIYCTINSDVLKSSMLLFISEVLYKAIKEEDANSSLFSFIYSAFVALDKMTGKFLSFHLVFLVRMTKYLGFYPNSENSIFNSFFDLKEGKYVKNKPNHFHYIDPYLCKYFSLLHTSFNQVSENIWEDFDDLSINNVIRNQLLEKIIEFYQLHLEGFKSINSHIILKEVFAVS